METGFSLALSFLIGGMLLISIMNFSSNISQTAILNNMDLSAQTRLQGIVEVVKKDLRKVGYSIDPDVDDEIMPSPEPTDSSIKFRTDIDTVSGSQN